MKDSVKRSIVCPRCSHGQKMYLVTAINNVQNPQFKSHILDESFFDFTCKSCGYRAQMVYPVVYLDAIKNYMIALAPLEYQEDELLANSKIDGIVKRTVKTLAQLKEKILIFDEGLQDVAIELVKKNLHGVFKNTYKAEKLRMHFCRIDEENNLVFALFIDDKEEAVYQNVKYVMYKQSVEVLKSIRYQENDEFLFVDSNYVRNLLK